MLFHRVDDVGPEDEAVHGVLALFAERGLPAIAAVIPEHLRRGTVRALWRTPAVAVFQHGVAHVNRARPRDYHDEFPAHLGARTIGDELARGREILEQRLGVSVNGYVPPWNRTSGVAHAALARLGFEILSGNRRYRPRTVLRRQDISIDVVTGCAPVRFRSMDAVMADLRAASAGQESVGIMYHVQRTGSAGVRFVEELLRRMEELGFPARGAVSPGPR